MAYGKKDILLINFSTFKIKAGLKKKIIVRQQGNTPASVHAVASESI